MSSKLTALTALTSASDDDLLYVVDAPGGTPASRKITLANLFGGTSNEVRLPSTAFIYFGATGTDGSWRVGISSGNLSFQKRESGSWVEKGLVGA